MRTSSTMLTAGFAAVAVAGLGLATAGAATARAGWTTNKRVTVTVTAHITETDPPGPRRIERSSAPSQPAIPSAAPDALIEHAPASPATDPPVPVGESAGVGATPTAAPRGAAEPTENPVAG